MQIGSPALSLIKVAFCVLLLPGMTFPRFRLGEVKVSAPAPPVPLRAIVCCGLPVELSLSVMAPFRSPAAVGVKLAVIEQFWLTLRVPGIGQ